MLNKYNVIFVWSTYDADTTIEVKEESEKHAVESAKKMVSPELLETVEEIRVEEVD